MNRTVNVKLILRPNPAILPAGLQAHLPGKEKVGSNYHPVSRTKHIKEEGRQLA